MVGVACGPLGRSISYEVKLLDGFFFLVLVISLIFFVFRFSFFLYVFVLSDFFFMN